MVIEITKEQYKNSSNLDIRIQFHEQFSTNETDWHEWLFEQYDVPDNSVILELGCGNGAFWTKNKHRFPGNWNIILTDFSEGMLLDAQHNIGELLSVQYKQVDVQDIPFEDHSFDVIIANHMLYHVPDRNKALQEIRRVLKPNGIFYSSTNGIKHLVEFGELLKEFDSKLEFLSSTDNSVKFGLENGLEQLSNYFSEVNLIEYKDGLKVTDTQALVQYLISAETELNQTLIDEKLFNFKQFLEEKKQENDGSLSITKASGLFVAK